MNLYPPPQDLGTSVFTTVPDAFSDRELKSDWIDMNIVEITPSEAYAANSLWLNGTVLVPAGHPGSAQAIEDRGYRVVPVDVSEFQKLDGGLSCLSLRF